MTLAKSVLNKGSTFEVLPAESADDVPMKYSVQVCPRNKPRDVMYGYVVTHLDIEDWCLMHNYCLILHYPKCTRPALADERANPIDLF